ncbi:hypothetical protein QTP70_033355 [Hemibagrus guttatus]|uniref:Uncharacterized protein n=1 Tax=Hemibagrus guttatus TaxID=175788 RepID=A0AAE0RC78_9TELE|nr:hypothetical protein QTP70_033355 [Hemibagrus guttatus]KAK3570494.1 hypothetical protein QTP86_020063 [Hemibagrus guttatus]
MDERMRRSYGTETLDSRLLFGETSAWNRLINLAVGGFTSLLVIIFWYRQGDLEPKFRHLIYYTLASIVLLCLCANLYFHDVGR